MRRVGKTFLEYSEDIRKIYGRWVLVTVTSSKIRIKWIDSNSFFVT